MIFYFFRNVVLEKDYLELVFVFFGMEFFVLVIVIFVVSDGILFLIEESVCFWLELMEWYIWYMEIREGRIYFVFDILRECVKIFWWVLFLWDFGLEIVFFMGVVMGILVGI